MLWIFFLSQFFLTLLWCPSVAASNVSKAEQSNGAQKPEWKAVLCSRKHWHLCTQTVLHLSLWATQNSLKWQKPTQNNTYTQRPLLSQGFPFLAELKFSSLIQNPVKSTKNTFAWIQFSSPLPLPERTPSPLFLKKKYKLFGQICHCLTNYKLTWEPLIKAEPVCSLEKKQFVPFARQCSHDTPPNWCSVSLWPERSMEARKEEGEKEEVGKSQALINRQPFCWQQHAIAAWWRDRWAKLPVDRQREGLTKAGSTCQLILFIFLFLPVPV